MQGFDYLAWSVVGLQVLPPQKDLPTCLGYLCIAAVSKSLMAALGASEWEHRAVA